MKQYKFKCPICGKWHDVGTINNCFYAACFVNGRPKTEFSISAPTIPMLLKLLRKLNIEVAEVCDKLPWNAIIRANGFQESKTRIVLRGKTAGHYYFFELYSGACVYGFEPSDPNKLYVELGRAKNIQSAKSACQADFNKRRAR